jgi:glycine/sarcosine N-methyltransferase
MTPPADSFYDDMASIYHLIFDDWDLAIERQRQVLCRLLPPPDVAGPVLDCACGIGTQALGLARAGYRVEGSDLSTAQIERARAEAAIRGLDVAFRVDDMRQLGSAAPGRFGVVLAFDNALPHLDSDAEVRAALSAMRDRLRPGGQLLISLRDYGSLIEQHPAVMPPLRFPDDGRRRIVHQVWDWQDDRRYIVHLYITRQMPDESWTTAHVVGHYRAITPEQVASQAEQVGFHQVRVLTPAESGYYQPIVTAIRD